MKTLALVLPFLLAAALPSSIFAATLAPYAPMKKELAATLLKEMSRNKVKGLTIAVVDDGRIVWSRGFGYADASARIPATPDTVYRAGSISKVVTSLHAMQLADKGLLALDADVRAYVPEFSIRSRFPSAPAITPRMLMSHHSGLPTDVVAGMWSEHPASLAEYIPTLSRESLASRPGTEWRYSNVGFSLLGRAIEEIEGKDFSAAMRQGLLSPLGLASSDYELTPALAARYAKGYKAGNEAPRPTFRDKPAGSLFSTAPDLCRLAAAFMANDPRLLSAKAVAEMTTPQFPGLPLDFGHENGLGWMLSGLTLADGRNLVWHGGAIMPHQAFLALLPGERIAVAILANSEEASRFIATVGVRAVELALQARVGPPERIGPVAPATENPKPVRLSEDELARVAGSYATFGGMLGKVWTDHDNLKMWLWDREVELWPLGNGRFLPKAEHLFGLTTKVLPRQTLDFERVEGMDVLVLRGAPMPLPFEKIPARPIPVAWERRFGTYATSQPGEGICYKGLTLAEEDGLPVAKIDVSSGIPGSPTSQAVFPLVVVSDDEAVIGGIGIGTGGVVRAEEGGLYHSGYDFRRVQ